MKTIYIAEDGTQFDNYNDCENYEFNQKVKTGIVKIVGLNRDATTPIYFNDPRLFYKIRFLHIGDENSLNLFEESCSDYLELFGLTSPGNYAWSEEDTSWINIETLIGDCENELIKLKTAKTKLETLAKEM